MGIDVNIYVRTRDGQPPPDPTADRGELWGGSRITTAGRDAALMGGTHFIWTGDRYFDEHVPRGPWPQVRRTLVFLLEHCEQVWYLSDSGVEPDDYFLSDAERIEAWREFGELHEVTPQRLAALDAAYERVTGEIEGRF